MSVLMLDGKLVAYSLTEQGENLLYTQSQTLTIQQRQFLLAINQKDALSQSMAETLADNVDLSWLLMSGLLKLADKS